MALRGRLGAAVHRRLAARAAARARARTSGSRSSASTALLCLSVAGALLFGAHLVGVQREFIVTMFGDGEATGAHDGRYNVLLLGGDSGAGRWGLRPDSHHGRQHRRRDRPDRADRPAPQHGELPVRRGLGDGRAVPGRLRLRRLLPQRRQHLGRRPHRAVHGLRATPGVDATVEAVEGITGLEINYYAMVNLKGFQDLVDAVGGVTLNVRAPDPGRAGSAATSTGYIEPGTRKLDGYETLWFARAREGSDDYSRMARQKCVMNAMLQQISPQTALRNFENIAKASRR